MQDERYHAPEVTMNPPDVAALREVGHRLASAGYEEDTLAAALGLARLADLRPTDIALYERRLHDQGSLAPLVRLFLFGTATPRTELEPVLPASSLAALCAHGLVTIVGAVVQPQVQITPFDGLILAHDADHKETLEPDHVLGISPTSRTLHALTVRAHAEQALDVGTGCGVQALCLARHTDRVIATDVNPRAVRYAVINAALNGINNVEIREGSLLEPVAGETFDLVVANPPFVISPEATYMFRDAGQDGNVSRRLATDIPGVLRPDGFAQLLINWEVTNKIETQAEPRSWPHETECDAWLLSALVEDSLTYAAKWNAWLRQTDPARFASTLDRWTTYYAERGITAVGTGALTLRRRVAGEPWWRADHCPSEPGARAGDHVQRVFTAQDQLQSLHDVNALLDTTPRLVDGHRLDQSLRYRGGEYVVDDVRLRLESGAGVVCTLEPRALLIILAIDGQHTVRQLIDEAGEGLTADDAEALAGVSVSAVQRLAGLGMLTLDGVM